MKTSYIITKNRVLALCLLLLSSCDSGILWSDHPYEVHWVDTHSNVTLARRINGGPDTIGRVEAEVVAVGSNSKYVVAKQIELGGSSVNFFYIEKAKDDTYLNLEEITKGPFSEKRFNELKATLNLPEFNKEFRRTK